MKKTLLTMAAALALVGCSNDDLMTGLENNGAQTKGAIGVNTFAPTITRGAALNSVDDLIVSENGFDLISFYNEGTEYAPNYTLFMGTEDGNGAVNDGIEFKHDGSAWDYADRGEIKFWKDVPEDATDMKFFAVSPTLSKWESAGSFSITTDEQSITYTVPEDVSDQVDIMYAQKDLADGEYESDQDAYTNGVPLNFHHALSQIVFKAKIADKEDTDDDGTANYVTAHVNSITVKNVYGAGTFDMDAASEILQAIYYEDGDLDDKRDNEDYNYSLWDTEDATSDASYIINAGDNEAWADITSTEAVDLTDGTVGVETALMLLPQQLEGLDLAAISGGNSANEEQFDTYLSGKTGAYLMVNCRVEYKGNDGTKYIVGTETEYANLYIPISTEWNPGYKYVYTLIFSADSGDPVKATVESVDEWNTYEEDVPETGEDDNTGEEAPEKSEDELTQAELNARLIANWFASANAASISADGVTFIENSEWSTTEDEIDHSMYFSYENLNNNGLLNTPIADENDDYWRVPTADEWNMLVITDEVFKQVYGENNPMWSDNMSEQESTETVNIDGQETTTTLTIGPAFAVDAISRLAKEDWSIGALRFKGTKQHAAYLYSPVTLESGIYALEIRIKALKSDEEVEFGDIFVADNWNDEDCIKIVLPALNYSNGSGFESFYMNDKSAWYLTSTSTEVQGLGTTPKVHYFNSIDGLFGKLQASSYGLNTYHSVRLIKCDSDGNLVLE